MAYDKIFWLVLVNLTMVVGSSGSVSVMVNSFSAMAKIFAVCVVGVVAAKYPKNDPLLPVSALRYLSRLSNLVLLPCLIIFSLGSALSWNLLNRIGILVFFCLLNSVVSFLLAGTIGKWMHEKNNPALFSAVFVSVGFPNAISLPIMVLQTLCEGQFKVDFDNDSLQCYASASSMLFVYSMGFHLLFWSYGFPVLQGITDILDREAGAKNLSLASNNEEGLTSNTDNAALTNNISVAPTVATSSMSNINIFDFSLDDPRLANLVIWVKKVLFTPPMTACFVGIFIGIITPFREVLFSSGHPLKFIGSAIETLGSPVVCLSCLIMSASLAHGDFTALQEKWTAVFKQIETFLFNEVLSNQFKPKHAPLSGSGHVNEHGVLVMDSPPGSLKKENITQNPMHHQQQGRSSGKAPSLQMPTSDDVERNRDRRNDNDVMVDDLEANTNTNTTSINTKLASRPQQTRRNSTTNTANNHNYKQLSNTTSNSASPFETIELATSEEMETTRRRKQSESELDEILLMCALDGKTVVDEEEERHKQEGADEEVENEVIPLPQWRSVAALIVCRLLLPPLVMILNIKIGIALGLLDVHEKMMLVIILVESASPSAQTIIVCLNQIGVRHIASGLAFMYLFLYLASILTVTMWTTVAISLYY